MQLVLASQSPARRRVLENAGLRPRVVVSGVDEDIAAPSTEALVLELAERKAMAVAPQCPDSLVIGCDSMLDVDGTPCGKPASPEEARAMWHRQSGATGRLFTGHCVVDTRSGRRASSVGRTVVRFGTPDDRELDAYIASGEPLAVAGAFTIDGRGAAFVEGVDGDPNNVVGLSVVLLRGLLAELGVSIADLWDFG